MKKLALGLIGALLLLVVVPVLAAAAPAKPLSDADLAAILPPDAGSATLAAPSSDRSQSALAPSAELPPITQACTTTTTCTGLSFAGCCSDGRVRLQKTCWSQCCDGAGNCITSGPMTSSFCSSLLC